MTNEINKDDRAKRLKKNKDKSENLNAVEPKQKATKNWKEMYIRSSKLKRAKQLGTEYPKKTIRQTLDEFDESEDMD